MIRLWVLVDPQGEGEELWQLLEAKDGEQIPMQSGSISRKGKMNDSGYMPFYFIYSYSLHSIPFLFFATQRLRGRCSVPSTLEVRRAR